MVVSATLERSDLHRLEILAEMIEWPVEFIIADAVRNLLNEHADEINEYTLRRVSLSLNPDHKTHP